MGMQPGYIPPSGSMNPPPSSDFSGPVNRYPAPGPLTEASWNNRHKSGGTKSPEEKNSALPGCMHPCCGPSYGPNDRKLVIKNETMHKLWLSFWKAGISYEDATVVVQDMQKNGIFFREEE